MGYAITVMNAKGGVGKSTLVLALAETLATHHRRRVLVVDSDAHASVSNMLMSLTRLAALQDHDLSRGQGGSGGQLEQRTRHRVGAM